MKKHNGNEKLKIDREKFNLTRKKIRNRLVKRSVSLGLSATMLASTVGAINFSDFFKPFGIGGEIPVKAYDVSDFEKSGDVIVDGVSHPYYEITSKSGLIGYTQAYYEYDGHGDDVVVLDFGSGDVTVEYEGFESIGNDANPFGGIIVFGQTCTTDFGLDCPFFGTVKDNARIIEGTIADDNGTMVLQEFASNKAMTIRRTQEDADEPLVARKIIDDGTSASIGFVVSTEIFSELGNNHKYPFSGFIGSIEDNATVSLDATNNVLLDGVAAEVKKVSGGDIGLLCCSMGDGASLDATYAGSVTSFNISTTSGNAGGLVGTMGSGSSLSVAMAGNPQSSNDPIYTDAGYAGGLVGYNNGGSVTLNLASADPYSISQSIKGTTGVGSVYGYYRPSFTDNEYTFDINDYSINTVLDGSVSVGGLFGELSNSSNGSADEIIITTSGSTTNVTANNATTSITNYGGLIGQYDASETSDSLTITDISCTANSTVAVTNYGGAIGCVSGDAYVMFDSFTLNDATGDRSSLFGGLVAEAENGYIYAKDVVIGGEETLSGFNGGGLVGNLSNGVLGMEGTISVSNAVAFAGDANGHLVGYRDNGFVYANGWTYSCCSSDVSAVDNIGSWGDVLLIDGNKLKINTSEDSANVFNESAHIISIDSVDTTALANAADFAKTSILFQIDPASNSFISGTQLANNVGLTFADDIDLTGTGLRGITRDNGSRTEYSGTVDGGDNTITLDVKNVGSNNPVYRHAVNGLFGKLNNATLRNLNVSGNIVVNPKKDDIYAGAFAATATGTLTATNCNTESALNIQMIADKSFVAGRFVGSASGMADISVTNCEFDGTISGNGSVIGGVFGKVGANTSSVRNWTFENVVLKGNVTGNNSVAGLIAETTGSDKAVIKIGSDSNPIGVIADGIVVSGIAGSMGGLLGYSWNLTDVKINKMSLANSPTVNCTGNGEVAGLVYKATGHWIVNNLDLSGLKMSVPSAKSVGVIVNKGTADGNGIYLELPSGYSYDLSFTGDTAINASAVFDELCAYSASSASNIMSNGQGIVSVHVSNIKTETSAVDSNSYKNKTTYGAKANPNTRYYYDLDTVTLSNYDPNMSYSDSRLLMSWGVNQYAAKNIKKYFADPFTQRDGEGVITGVVIPDGTYDMNGLSWYPVSVAVGTQVDGTFKFYNEEFTSCENSKSTANKWLPDSATKNQHYMMQNGLFYNVSKNMTIGNVVLQGTIGAVDTSGTGALVYGKIVGSSAATEDKTIIDSSNGSISLDGIRVWNFQGTENTSPNYAPLLINKTGNFVSLNISNVSTTSSYAVDAQAGTSLIGIIGTDSTDNVVSVEFSKIKLDARVASNDPALTGFGYGTTRSIFTRATLLERLNSESGSYTFSHADDWGSGSHNVTYGLELWDGSTDGNSNPDNHSSGRNQYVGLERWYARSSTSDPQYAVNYASSQTSAGDLISFGAFRPYVATVSSLPIQSGQSQYYQLRVNHQPSTELTGCGTYNDPYIISTADDLINISRWIASETPVSTPINAEFGDTWCTDKTEHKRYTYEGGNYVSGSDTRSWDEIRKYLAGAYYLIRPNSGSNIELAAVSGFVGLGTNVSGYRFHGVIVGGNNSITNKTPFPLITYSDGSVVKDLTVSVDSSDLTNDRINCKGEAKTYETQTQNVNQIPAYGAIFGQILGGDNIIDNVQLDLTKIKIRIESTNQSQYVPVGGYVGVLINGGLIFRNMSGSISGLTDNSLVTNAKNITNGSMIDSDNNAWLFVNPIIGRVISGYAVTETDSYEPREANVTMKNSTGSHSVVKNYSITDIKKADSLSDSEKLDVTSQKKINVPNSQSLYIMSLIVNSGLGIQQGVNKSDLPTTGTVLGYYTGYYTLHYGLYNEVGNASSSDYTNKAKNDIFYSKIASSDYVSKKVAYVPYLVKAYTVPYTATISSASPSSQTVYYAKTLTNFKSDDGKSQYKFDITLSNNDPEYVYDLSDGFRGIDNLFITDDDAYRLNINSFDGKGHVISQNTKYYYYSTDCVDNYRPANSETAGLGLINCLNTNGRFDNIILTGSVKCDALNISSYKALNGNTVPNGYHIEYKTETTNSNRHLSAAMLIATVASGYHPTIDSVALQDIDVRGVRHTGGLIGNVVKGGNGAGNIIYITNTKLYDSNKIKVHGAGSVAGLIGRNQEGIVQIDLSGCHFDIDEIVSECSFRWADAHNSSNDNKSDYNYGVAGFIGICRSGQNYKANNKIENVIIGSTDKEGRVQCTHGGTLFTGGVVAVINRANVDVNNCTFYNLSVDSNYTSGGLVADCITDSTPNVTNTFLISTMNSNIRAANSSGGFIGNTDERSDGGSTFTLRNSSISGYTISGQNAAGGIIGYRGAKSDSAILQIENVAVSDCLIKSDASAGGIAGEMNHPIYGYNILCNDLEFEAYTDNGTITNNGYIVGLNSNNKDIKLVGFSRSETVVEGEASNMLSRMTGGDDQYKYGSNGYVIFADYNGSCLGSDYSETFSGINSGSNVAITYINGTNYPFVTSTNMTMLDESYEVSTNGTTYVAGPGQGFITSDALSDDAIASIISDMASENNGYYSVAKSNIATSSGYISDYASASSAINVHLSTFKQEMGTKATVPGLDFPLLVVDDVSQANTNALVNNYLRFLTNTNYDYNSNSSAYSNIFTVKLSRCYFDGTDLKIDESANAACLKKENEGFKMDSKRTDTASEYAQFTLLDVQFKNPCQPSEVAYHLYVPVYVRKLLQYDFNIRLESGTYYVPSQDISQNTLLENLGVPVTAEFEYVYTRTNTEWQDAVNGGDSLLGNYNKKLLFMNSSLSKEINNELIRAGFESQNPWYDCNTKMVLIDSQNSGRAYYLDSLTDGVFAPVSANNRELNLQMFRDSDGTAFRPANLNDLMTVTATQDSNGTFLCIEDGYSGTATVQDNSGLTYDGKTFRPIDSGDGSIPSNKRYSITISNATSVKEHYFLTIYTDANYNASGNLPTYHYAITSPDTLGSDPYPSRVEDNSTAHLVTGDIYNTTLQITAATDELDMFNGVHIAPNGDYVLNAHLEATVAISDSASSVVDYYLRSVPSIEIYQSFLASLNMKHGQNSEKGIKALKSVSVSNYKVKGRVAEDQSVPSANANFIEFRNNVNLRPLLTQGYVPITADITLSFSKEDVMGDDTTDPIKPAQFYSGPLQDVGTTLVAYSNIASNMEKTAYSKVSIEVEDVDHMYYYNSGTERTDLLYSAYPDPVFGQYGQLGINANELDENPVPLNTIGVYDVSKFQSKASMAQYIKVEVEMLTIDDGYNVNNKLILSDYLTDFGFVTGTAATSSDTTTNNKKWEFVYPVSAFEYKSQTYQIPIDYSIFTGSTDEFEGSNMKYSNYQVIVTVSLLDENQDLISGSSATDYIKYTNARIFVGRVDPNKTGSGNQGNGG